MNQTDPHPLQRQMEELYQRVNYERQSSAGPRSFKLQTMHDLMHRLGHPHQACPVVHVTGTKGKGSVSKMIGEILRDANLKTGVYSSPHLETINQRISINDELISDDQFSAVLTQIQPAVEALDAEFAARNERGLTFFEIITAAGFQHFANENVDVVVLEVGLGGRLDSTNVCQPAVCVITNISLDHTKQLGDTIAEIAFEKAGIIKPGVPIVSGALHPDAIEVISKVAVERGAHLFQLDRDVSISDSNDGSFTCNGSTKESFAITNLKPRMPGDHQRANAALAVTAARILVDQGWAIDEDNIRIGISKAALPGRTEILSTSPFVLMDMAHNGASVEALIRTFNSQLNETTARKRFLLATTREKETAEIVNPIVSVADEIILTRYQNNPRGKPIDELSTAVQESISWRTKSNQSAPSVRTFTTPQEAWQYLADSIEEQDAVCIAGSAFLVAELRPTVQSWVADRC
jgi:dihydrofolate synthase/folylpolyglutamate synthase